MDKDFSRQSLTVDKQESHENEPVNSEQADRPAIEPVRIKSFLYNLYGFDDGFVRKLEIYFLNKFSELEYQDIAEQYDNIGVSGVKQIIAILDRKRKQDKWFDDGLKRLELIFSNLD
ncbi:MAG: hypothetical protein GY850_08925 [bacterium]|nr:hypothetical protein [bacterium]